MKEQNSHQKIPRDIEICKKCRFFAQDEGVFRCLNSYNCFGQKWCNKSRLFLNKEDFENALIYFQEPKKCVQF